MKRWIATSLVALLAVLTVVAATASAQESPEPTAPPSPQSSPASDTADERTFTVGTTQDLSSVSPFQMCCTTDYEAMFLMYDQLLNFDPETLAPAPGIAESWEQNDDATVWTFKIRPDLKWSDGQPLTAEDVKFTYDFVLNNRPNSFAGYLPGDPKITTPDPLTVVYETEKPTLAPAAPAWVPILPPQVWAKYDGKEKEARSTRFIPTVGTGPFQITQWKEGEFFTFEKNPYWRGPDPYLNKIIFRIFDVEESMVQALKSGEIDFARAIPPALFRRLESEADPTIETWKAAENSWVNLAFGLWKPSQKGWSGETPTNHPALLDPQVRVAIAKAIDKQELVEKAMLGYGHPGTAILLPTSRYFIDPQAEGDTTQNYDPEAANAILDGAGYLDADGDGVREMPGGGNPLELQILTITDSPGSVDSGAFIKEYLADVGIKAVIKPVSTGKGYDAWYAHDFDAYIWSWGGEPDPDFMLSIFTTGECDNWSDGCYSNPEYDGMYEEQRLATSETDRLEMVAEMQRFLYKDVPEVNLFYLNDLQAWRKDRWTGMIPQPAPTGAVLYGWGPASYLNLQPVVEEASGASGTGGGGADETSPVVFVVIGLVAVVAVAIVVALVRRKPEDDRE